MDFEYIGKILRYILFAVVSLVLVFYILYHMTGGFSPDMKTIGAVSITQDETITCKTIIMRNESVIYSTVSGSTNYLVNDGVRVSKNAKLCEVYPRADSDGLYNEIVSLNKRIDLLEKSNMTEAERRSDTQSTDKAIWNDFYNYTAYSKNGNMSAADILKDNLLINLNKRRIITKSVTSYTPLIKELTEQRDELYASLSNAETLITADSAGYFYSFVDGYENIFQSADISLLTFSSFKEKSEMPPSNYEESGFGYPVGKIVTDYVWYIASEVNYNELHYFETGKTYSVRFPQNNGVSVNMTLYRILYGLDTETAVLILRARELPENFSYTRNQTVQIVRQSYTGYRVPTSAVHMVDGYHIVYTLRGTQVIMKRVEPLYEYDGYFICSERTTGADDPIPWLGRNDLIITEGKNLYDKRIID